MMIFKGTVRRRRSANPPKQLGVAGVAEIFRCNPQRERRIMGEDRLGKGLRRHAQSRRRRIGSRTPESPAVAVLGAPGGHQASDESEDSRDARWEHSSPRPASPSGRVDRPAVTGRHSGKEAR